MVDPRPSDLLFYFSVCFVFRVADAGDGRLLAYLQKIRARCFFLTQRMNQFQAFLREKFPPQNELPRAEEACRRADLVVSNRSEPEHTRQSRLLLKCTQEINKAVARGKYACQCSSDGSHSHALQMKDHLERAGYTADASAFSEYQYGDTTGLYVSWKK